MAKADSNLSGSRILVPAVRHISSSVQQEIIEKWPFGSQIRNLDVLPAGSWAVKYCHPTKKWFGRFTFTGCSLNWQLDSQRRRWESNPLRPGCSRLPYRLAPASMLGSVGGHLPPTVHNSQQMARHYKHFECFCSISEHAMSMSCWIPYSAVRTGEQLLQ